MLEDGDGGPEGPPVGRELDVVADGSEHLVGGVHIVTMVKKGLQRSRALHKLRHAMRRGGKSFLVFLY